MQIRQLRVTEGNGSCTTVDHGSFCESARIVLEQIDLTQQKVTSNRDQTLNPRTVVPTSLVYNFMPSQLSYLGKC